MTRGPSRARCPTCHRDVEIAPEKRPKEFPFCTERCRLLDLHRWFAGDYSVPAAQPTHPEEAESGS